MNQHFQTLANFKKEVNDCLPTYALRLSELFHPIDISSSKYREPHLLDYRDAFLNTLLYFKEKWNELDACESLKKKEVDEGRVFLIATLLRAFIEDPIITSGSIYELSDEFFNHINVKENILEALKHARKVLQGKLFSEFLLSDAQTSVHELCDIIAISIQAPLKDKIIYAVDELQCPPYFSIGLSKDIKRLKKELLVNLEGQSEEMKELTKQNETALLISKDDKKLKVLLNEHKLKEDIPFIIDFEPWPTILHYYYAEKIKAIKDEELLKKHLLEIPADSLQNYLHLKKIQMPSDWLIKEPDEDTSPKELYQKSLKKEYGRAFYTMAKALAVKFNHPFERATLLDTKNCALKITDAAVSDVKSYDLDPFEGLAVDGKNKNYLGKLLEGLRTLIKEGTL